MTTAFQNNAFQNNAFQIDGAGPPPPAPTVPIVGVPNVPTPRSKLGGLLDQLLDPMTLDYVDSADGEWVETADSRTIFLIMAETRLGKSYGAPGDGTLIGDKLESGEPVTVGFVVAEYRRIAAILTAAGVLSDYSITTQDEHGHDLVDVNGRFSPIHHWTDLATGTAVDLVYSPEA